MIEISHLTKKYGTNVAVNDLSLTLEPGNIYGFLGPNGAGKSTTMNIITGYIGASSGEIKINGYDINKNPEEAKKSIGYLPEIPPVYGDMKVLEYLKFVAELKKLDSHTRNADIKQVMDLTKLHEMKDRLIRNLSKGYKQRVGLAQALLGYPEVIILDEPTVGLDPAQIIEMRGLIRSLGKKHTVILSSHILSEISAVCDDVLILSHGKLVASDTTDNLGKLMEDKVTLHLTVKGDEAAIKGVLDAVDGVENIEYTDSEEKGCVDVMIQSDPKAEVREMIFYRLAAVQCPIYAMNQMKKSLEDVFIELTADGTETSAKAQNNEDPHEDELHEEDHEEHEEHPGETDETDEEDGKEAAEHDSDL